MADSRRKGCCCCNIIISIFSSLLLAYLFLRPKRPICSIQDIYLPALNKSLNSTTNHTIFFDLKLDNPNVLKGIYYDPLNLTFSFGPNNASIPLAFYTAPGFYQGHHKKTNRRDVVNASGGTAVINGSVPSVLRVDLVTAVRIKNIFWTTKRKKVVVGADVLVNDDGRKVNKKGVRLVKSGAGDGHCYSDSMVLMMVLSLLSIYF